MALKVNSRRRWIVVGGTALAGIFVSIALIRSDAFWNALSPVFHKDLLYVYAGEYKLDPLLVAAVIHVESKFNPVATSHKGAMGLMQLMPATARELAGELDLEVVNDEELYVRETNIRIGFYYLAKLHREFNGNSIFALAAYNAGLSRAKAWAAGASGASGPRSSAEGAATYHGEDDREVIAGIPLKETREFVERVLSTYRRFKFVRGLKHMLGGA